MTLLTVKETAAFLIINPNKLWCDISTGRINSTVYRKLSERKTRFIKENLEKALLDGNLYAPD